MYSSNIEYNNNLCTLYKDRQFLFDKNIYLKCVIDLHGGYFLPRFIINDECKAHYNIRRLTGLENKKVNVIYIKTYVYGGCDIHSHYKDTIKKISDTLKQKYISVCVYSFMNQTMINLTFKYGFDCSAGTKLLLFKKYCDTHIIPNELFLYIMSFLSYYDLFGSDKYVNIKNVCLL